VIQVISTTLRRLRVHARHRRRNPTSTFYFIQSAAVWFWLSSKRSLAEFINSVPFLFIINLLIQPTNNGRQCSHKANERKEPTTWPRDVYVCFVGLDYEKTFDRVDWKMMEVLRSSRVDCRDKRLTRDLYLNQAVRIRIDGVSSETGSLGRSVRQSETSVNPTVQHLRRSNQQRSIWASKWWHTSRWAVNTITEICRWHKWRTTAETVGWMHQAECVPIITWKKRTRQRSWNMKICRCKDKDIAITDLNERMNSSPWVQPWQRTYISCSSEIKKRITEGSWRSTGGESC
jgi:uncharacterized membrane protein